VICVVSKPYFDLKKVAVNKKKKIRNLKKKKNQKPPKSKEKTNLDEIVFGRSVTRRRRNRRE